VTHEDIANEVRAIDKLRRGAHPNLTLILRHDWLHQSCYFIDMELCDMNLDTFIHQPLDWTPFRCEDHPDYLYDENPPIWWRTWEIFHIMFQISNGLAFIHQNNQVHRDLKPRNGNVPHAGSHLTFSVIFIVDRGLETCRFRHML